MQDTARPVRNLAVDFYRVSGVVLIVLGHWLAGSVTYHDGQFGRENPLVDLPWTQWLTWIFQAVPVFFLAAGYAGAVSWTHRCGADGFSREVWLRHRLARVLGPTAVYMALVSVIVVVLAAFGMPGLVLEYAGWAVAMHLWFLAVYVVVVSLTPIAVAAQRRWGLAAPAALAAGVVVVDAVSIGGHVPYLGWLNYLLCWGTLYQLGIAWHGGLLATRRAALLAAGSAVALALLIWLRLYPVSMIGVPGQTIDNTTPPTVALLAFGCAQTGIVMTLAPALNRALRADFVQRVLVRREQQRDGALSLAHDPRCDRGDRRLPGGPAAATARGNGGVVAGSAGVGRRPQRGDGVRDRAVVVAATLLRGPTAHGRHTPVRIAGAKRSCWPVPRWSPPPCTFSPMGASRRTGTFHGSPRRVFAVGVLLVALRPTKVGRRSADPGDDHAVRKPHEGLQDAPE